MSRDRPAAGLARAYCREAAKLGTVAGDHRRAADLARKGVDLAGTGSQQVRLLVNGQARALGKLGNATGVHAAVEQAYQAVDRMPDIRGVSPCVSFGGYSRSRLASNAVTAYVDLGMPDQVAAHAALAMEEFDGSESSWSKSLIRLDLANSFTLAGDGDPDEASSYVTAALNFSAEKPIASVVQRSRSFARRGPSGAASRPSTTPTSSSGGRADVIFASRNTPTPTLPEFDLVRTGGRGRVRTCDRSGVKLTLDAT